MLRFLLFLLLLGMLTACLGPAPPVQPLKTVDWSAVDGWQSDDLREPLEVFQQNCRAIGKRQRWQQVCAEAAGIDLENADQIRLFFETRFQPYQLQNEDGSSEGLITGYYGPELAGSRVRTELYRYPLYAQPDDLLIVDLDEVYPELSGYRLRGRLYGNRVVPYFERGEIDQRTDILSGSELFWVADPVELFFLHIQGSGRIRLSDDEVVMVNYANQNGHPYRSIGALLLERNAMSRDQMSMQNIRSWVKQNPEAGRQLLAENPSYVFFRELPEDFTTPPGSLGIPLTPQRSLAVDKSMVPLGAPVFLSTTYPSTDQPLRRLMLAQDTGGAIKGRVRADFFWGMGEEAGQLAGRMKQAGRLWVLLPKQDILEARDEPKPTAAEVN